MRLSRIKLAGFKSFVDPTTVQFRSNLTAVVGPNGCGKSNVIDAVRWVMGEGSAKTLRASAMTDVIFNGSTHRQGVGKASIELVFDNSDQTLTGEYAAFSEISVRREVTRDAQSFYYLNGTRCRRRDITDLFLGTGLGPRSYAIIEQGMINRFIEARPEELRGYIEEAAGVSRYKERRRETESRLKRTRENLDRLGDLEDELSRQLSHLKRQAEAAKRFKSLSEDILKAQIHLAAFRWGQCQASVDAALQRTGQIEASIQDRLVERESVQGQIEAQRQLFDDTQQALERAQADFYSAGADVSRLEALQKNHRDQVLALEQNQARARARLQTAQQALSQDDAEYLQQQAAVTEMQAQLDAAEQQAEPIRAQVAAAEQAWKQAREAFQQAQQARLQAEQSLRMTQRDVTQAQREVDQLAARRQRLSSGRPTAPEVVSIDVQSLADQLAALEQTCEQQQSEFAAAQQQVDQHQSQCRVLESEQSQVKASLAALERAMGQVSQNAPAGPKLLDDLAIPADQARAVASALGDLTQARRISDWSELGETGQYVVSAESSLQGLLSLRGAMLAPSREQAIARRNELAPGQFFVCPDGEQIGAHWCVLSPQVDPLPEMQAQQAELSDTLDTLTRQREGLENVDLPDVASLEQALCASQEQRAAAQRELDRAGAEQAATERLIAEHAKALERYQTDLDAIERDSEDAHVALEEALEAQTLAAEALAELPEPSNTSVQLEAAWHDARDAWDDHQTQVSSVRLRFQTAQARVESLAERVERARVDVDEARDALEELAEQAEQLADPEDYQGQLNQAVAHRLKAEQELAQAREAMQGFDAQVRDLETRRAGAEQALEQLRADLAEARTEISTQQALQQTQSEFLQSAEQDPREQLAQLEGQTETQLMVALERLEKQRERQGAVNLAAMDELAEAQERQDYYAQQRQDLESALDTLDGAIRKIDRETRALFRETFDRVNQSLQALFPKVFGGGEAWLEMTDEDPLETGISLMARPPGKKNSTIHLLSGGEKALTAVALVFAIFQLNPAPFCMLDEVDAPLDDANVGRYANLLQEMADQVQFIFVTHNKIAMEKAEHLMGVTMHEPGVSRLVSVDVAEAVAMTES